MTPGKDRQHLGNYDGFIPQPIPPFATWEFNGNRYLTAGFDLADEFIILHP